MFYSEHSGNQVPLKDLHVRMILINWTDWDGEDLIAPSAEYDKVYPINPG